MATQRISEQVGVVFTSTPYLVKWRNRNYKITELGLHHKYRRGITLYHVFSVISSNLFMRLVLNSDDLKWTLEEISDGF